MIGLWSDWRLKKGGWRPAVVVNPVAIRNVPDRIHEVFEVFNHTSTTIGRIRKQGLVLLLEPFIVRGTWMFETCCREAILWWSSRNPSSTLRGTFGSTDYYGDAFDHFSHFNDDDKRSVTGGCPEKTSRHVGHFPRNVWGCSLFPPK